MKLTRITSYFSLLFLVLFQSCSDGNLDIASFEFQETVNVCGSYTLYRLSTDGQKEALIVTLTAQQIRQDEDPVIPVQVSTSGLYTVTDRVFDDQVNNTKKYMKHGLYTVRHLSFQVHFPGSLCRWRGHICSETIATIPLMFSRRRGNPSKLRMMIFVHFHFRISSLMCS